MEANFYLLFSLISGWNWTPCFSSTHGALILSPVTVWKLPLSDIRWSPKNILLRALGLKFYSFSTSHLQFIQLFLMAELWISVLTWSLPSQYTLVSLHPQIWTYYLHRAEDDHFEFSVFLLLQPRFSIVFFRCFITWSIYSQGKHLWFLSHLYLSWYTDSLLLSSLSYN